MKDRRDTGCNDREGRERQDADRQDRFSCRFGIRRQRDGSIVLTSENNLLIIVLS